MEYDITFKNMASSPALAHHAQDKIGAKLAKFVPDCQTVHITFLVEHGEHIVRLDILQRDGHNVHLEQSGSFMYSSVDKICEKLVKKLRRSKDKELSQLKVASNSF